MALVVLDERSRLTLVDVEAVLDRLGNPPKDQVVMVGDRKHDVQGAGKVGLETIGVEYGFAPPGELKEAGATWIVPTVAALEELCWNLCRTGKEG